MTRYKKPAGQVFASLTPEERKRKLAVTIARGEGNLRRVAHMLGVDRRLLYYYIEPWGLWPVVNEARRARLRRLANARIRQRLFTKRRLSWHTEK